MGWFLQVSLAGHPEDCGIVTAFLSEGCEGTKTLFWLFSEGNPLLCGIPGIGGVIAASSCTLCVCGNPSELLRTNGVFESIIDTCTPPPEGVELDYLDLNLA